MMGVSITIDMSNIIDIVKILGFIIRPPKISFIFLLHYYKLFFYTCISLYSTIFYFKYLYMFYRKWTIVIFLRLVKIRALYRKLYLTISGHLFPILIRKNKEKYFWTRSLKKSLSFQVYVVVMKQNKVKLVSFAHRKVQIKCSGKKKCATNFGSLASYCMYAPLFLYLTTVTTTARMWGR